MNGKGSRSRTKNAKAFRKNFEKIHWGRRGFEDHPFGRMKIRRVDPAYAKHFFGVPLETDES